MAEKLSALVDKDVLVRLNKAGIKKLEDLSRFTPIQIMELSRIGPKTTHKLYMAIGQKHSMKALERHYWSMRNRTRFQNLQLNKFTERVNLERAENVLQGTRGALIALGNMAQVLSSFGKPGDRTFYDGPSELTFEEVAGGFSRKLAPASRVKAFQMEVRINATFRGSVLTGYQFDWHSERRLDNSTDDRGNVFYPEPDSEVKMVRFLKEKLQEVRVKDPLAPIYIVLTEEASNQIEAGQQDFIEKHLPEFKDDIRVTVVIDHEWERVGIKQKYLDNPVAIEAINKINDFLIQLDFNNQDLESVYREFKRDHIDQNGTPWDASSDSFISREDIGLLWGVTTSFPDIDRAGYTKEIFPNVPRVQAPKEGRLGRLRLGQKVRMEQGTVDLRALIFVLGSFDNDVTFYGNPNDKRGRVLVVFNKLRDFGALLS